MSYHDILGPFLQLDGMLTCSRNDGIIYWKEKLDDEVWKSAELEIPRLGAGWAILQCD